MSCWNCHLSPSHYWAITMRQPGEAHGPEAWDLLPAQFSDERRYGVPVTVIACELTSEMLRPALITHGHIMDTATPPASH